MYSAAFIFRPGQYDDEFHRLNDLIDQAALADLADNAHAADEYRHFWRSQAEKLSFVEQQFLG